MTPTNDPWSADHPEAIAQLEPPLAEMRNVECRFRIGGGLFGGGRELRAVNGVSLAIRKGEVLGIVGESGSGKSTLARILLGLLPPTAGEIFFAGRPIGSFGPRALARRVQPVFQDPYSSLNPRRTVGAIIGAPLVVHRAGDPGERRREVERLMGLVGLPRRLYDASPGQLSGGQRQRVAIARALIMRPEMVICDEPTSALDVSVQSQILNLLQDLQQAFGLTYVLISHNLAVVEHMATRVAVMYLGRIVEENDTEALFRAPLHPYTRALLLSVLTPEPGLGVPDTHLGTAFPNPLHPPSGCPFHPRCPDAMAQCATTAPNVTPLDNGFVECHLYSSQAAAAHPTQDPLRVAR
jgi:peptide/nickel transport system ATP-binding protein